MEAAYIQIVPGNAFSASVSGSAPAGGAHRSTPEVQTQAVRQADPSTGRQRADTTARSDSANQVERPIPVEQRANMPPGSIIDIRV